MLKNKKLPTNNSIHQHSISASLKEVISSERGLIGEGGYSTSTFCGSQIQGHHQVQVYL